MPSIDNGAFFARLCRFVARRDRRASQEPGISLNYTDPELTQIVALPVSLARKRREIIFPCFSRARNSTCNEQRGNWRNGLFRKMPFLPRILLEKSQKRRCRGHSSSLRYHKSTGYFSQRYYRHNAAASNRKSAFAYGRVRRLPDVRY